MLTFVSPIPLLTKPTSPQPVRPNHRVPARRVARRARCLATQCAPEPEADWVIVDILQRDTSVADEVATQLASDAKRLVRHVLRDAPAELSLSLVSDAQIQQLNLTWRGKDAPTDVLSFPQGDDVVLGDIVISVDTATRQVGNRAGACSDLLGEIRVLLVHGLLHLLGYDHEGEKEGDWLVMARMESTILHAMGWQGEGLVAAVQDQVYKDIVMDVD